MQQQPLRWIATDSECKRHLCLPLSHGHNPGGVSEIWRLFKRKAMGAGPDGDDGFEMLDVFRVSLKGFTG